MPPTTPAVSSTVMIAKRSSFRPSNLSVPATAHVPSTAIGQRVHGRQQRAEPRVDDGGGHEQMERVGRNPQQVQQETASPR